MFFEILPYVTLIFLIIFWLCAVFSHYLPKKISCDIMGWHSSPKVQGFDGVSFGGKCPKCGKRVMKDSQGNWF